MNRFFVAPINIGENQITIDAKEDIRHIVKVLRLTEGSEIDISDSVEWEYRAEIATIEEDRVITKILSQQPFSREPDIEVTLFQGVPKQGKMEVIVQKCVEMGVYKIVPVFTDRTVVTDKGNFSKKVQRWQKVSAEAVKQCKRGIIPEVSEPLKFKELLPKLEGFDLVLFPYENEDGRTIKDAIRNLEKPVKTIGVIIGPEGGFSDEEAQQLKESNADCVSLGRTILRTETAGLATIAMIMYELTL